MTARRTQCLYGSVLLTLALCHSVALAQPDQENNPLSFDRNIQGLLDKHCYRCHNDNKTSGGVDLKSDTDPRQIAARPDVWRTALDVLESGQMPPDDAKQPNDEDRSHMIEFIKLTVADFDCSAPRDPGMPTLRRLNRVEYDNSIEYLTGLKLELSESFPEDAISFGFRNNAQSLTMSPLHVEQYYSAAGKIVGSVLDGANQSEGVNRQAFERIFFITPKEAGSEQEAAQQIAQRFALRAFRRDVEPDQFDRWLSLFAKARDEGESFETSVGHVLSAILTSPRFLMRSELQKSGESDVYRVDDFDLASRLSFFLWSAPPDDELLTIARRSGLHDAKELEKQTRRMLRDERSMAIVDQFFAAWLQFDELASHRPDVKAFPQWNNELRDAIIEQPRQLLAYMIREDRPITELIDASYTIANATLAKHEGLPKTKSLDSSFRLISLKDRRRGGLLTTSALLMAQSDPGRSNVPRRGNFIAAAILGTDPPPPPPDVPPLTEDATLVATLTLRERFEAHRADSQCSSCHAKIDPLGFALENYDAIGRWREKEVGKQIDASGELPDGRKFNGPIELKEILLERQEDLARILTQQMMIYALSRGPMLGDECVIDEVIASAKDQDVRFSSIILGIVQSYPFLHTKNPDF